MGVPALRVSFTLDKDPRVVKDGDDYVYIHFADNLSSIRAAYLDYEGTRFKCYLGWWVLSLREYSLPSTAETEYVRFRVDGTNLIFAGYAPDVATEGTRSYNSHCAGHKLHKRL